MSKIANLMHERYGIDVPGGDGWVGMNCPECGREWHGRAGHPTTGVNHARGLFVCQPCGVRLEAFGRGSLTGDLVRRYDETLKIAAGWAAKTLPGGWDFEHAYAFACEQLAEYEDRGELERWEAKAGAKIHAWLTRALVCDFKDAMTKHMRKYLGHELSAGNGIEDEEREYLAAVLDENLASSSAEDSVWRDMVDAQAQHDYPCLYYVHIDGRSWEQLREATGLTERALRARVKDEKARLLKAAFYPV